MVRHKNRCESARRARYLWLLGAVVALVLPVGCGKKGPLYLPDGAAAPTSSGGQVVQPAPFQPER